MCDVDAILISVNYDCFFFCVVEQMIDSNGNELFSQLSRKSIDTQSHEITPVQFIKCVRQFFIYHSRGIAILHMR